MRKATLLFVMISALCTAQEVELSEADVILDDLFVSDSLDVLELFDKLKKQDYLYTTVIYNNKTLFSGRDFGVNQYSMFPSISYIDGDNFFLNLNAGYYSGVNPTWDFVTLSGGYSNYLNKRKTLLASGVYSYSSYSQDVADLNNHRLTAGLSFRKKWFRNTLTLGYLFGGASSTFVSNNTYISIDILDTKLFDISLRPRIGFFWGNQTVSELVFIRPRQFEYVNTNYFQLLNTEVGIPVELDFGNWDVEIEYTFNSPKALPSEEGLKNSGFILLSLGYLIEL
ncbi:MAG: hypothetical protein DBW73_02505 [Flavobacteriales bacterium]|nr:MAG: hypothetical protein DBW73_02505 [Flavobacteriales bacterium]|tara:strand:- start:885 stop:1733 length:849 start_codon:yes stop_codon:yes gene_type:complete